MPGLQQLDKANFSVNWIWIKTTTHKSEITADHITKAKKTAPKYYYNFITITRRERNYER